MSPMKPLTFKIDDGLEQALIAIAAQRQEQLGQRVTVSDIIRETLIQQVNAELASHSEPNDFCIEVDDDPHLIRICEPYVPIGREILLPIHGAIGPQVIERDVSTKAYCVAKRGSVPEVIVETEGLDIPFFEIATSPRWHMREGLDREGEIIARARDSISRQEDTEVLSCISNAVPTDHTVTVEDTIGPSNLNCLCSKLWEHEVKVANVVYNPRWQDHINGWVEEQRGKVWPMKQRVEDVRLLPSTMVNTAHVFVLAPSSMVGRVTINLDVNVIENNNPDRLQYGRVVWESIGVCVINDYCTTKLWIV